IVEKIVDLGLPIKLGAFAKTQEEIEIATRIGLWGVTILVSVSESRIERAEDRANVIEKIRQLTSLAKDEGLYTIFMPMSSTNTRPEFLKEVILAVQENCDELCIADSRGSVSPFGYRYLIEHVGSYTTLPLSTHIHNHSSMAMANALGAVLGGASVLQTCVNGVGENSGILPLEEVAVALPMHLGVSTGIKLEGLKGLSDFVASALGIPISIHKPVVGDYTFAIPEVFFDRSYKDRKEGGYLDGTHPYPPELVGNKEYVPLGRKCNDYIVRYHLGIRGWTASPSTIQAIVEAVRSRASEAKGYYLMEESDFMKMVQKKGFELIPILEK
ncbi:hypothetical protein ACFL0D_08535, partial [Thermoproteota archaeon]